MKETEKKRSTDEAVESEEDDNHLANYEERTLVVKKRDDESKEDFHNRVRRERRTFTDSLAGSVDLKDYIKLNYPPEFYDHVVINKLGRFIYETKQLNN